LTFVLIGPPLTGKTSFINYAMNTSFHEGEEEVKRCAIYTFQVGNQRFNMIDTPGINEHTEEYIINSLRNFEQGIHRSSVVVILFWRFFDAETGDIERALSFVRDFPKRLNMEVDVQKHVVLSYASFDQPSKLPKKWRQKHDGLQNLCEIWQNERLTYFRNQGLMGDLLCVNMSDDDDKPKVYNFFSVWNILLEPGHCKFQHEILLPPCPKKEKETDIKETLKKAGVIVGSVGAAVVVGAVGVGAAVVAGSAAVGVGVAVGVGAGAYGCVHYISKNEGEKDGFTFISKENIG